MTKINVEILTQISVLFSSLFWKILKTDSTSVFFSTRYLESRNKSEILPGLKHVNLDLLKFRAARSPLHRALMRLCARSLVSFFSSSERGRRGGRGNADRSVSGSNLVHRALMNAVICSSVGFNLFRKVFTFLEKQNSDSLKK